MAGFQTMLLDWISKPWHDPNNNEISWLNMTSAVAPYQRKAGYYEGFEQMCDNQMVLTSAAVQNFSVLATALVVFFCGTVIAAQLVLPWVVSFLRRRRKNLGRKAAMRELARDADEKYQLLRMAMEGGRVGHWESGAFGVPVTESPTEVDPPIRDGGFTRYAPSYASRYPEEKPREIGEVDATLRRKLELSDSPSATSLEDEMRAVFGISMMPSLDSLKKGGVRRMDTGFSEADTVTEVDDRGYDATDPSPVKY